MAKKKRDIIEDLKKMKKQELEQRLLNLEEEMRSLRFKTEGAKSKNVKESFNLRKQIARVLTELHSSRIKAVK